MGVALTVKALKDLCRQYKPLVVFLMETRCSGSKMEGIKRRNRFHFPNSFYVDACGKSGGLAVWWKDDLNLNISFSSKNFIHAFLSSPHCDVPHCLSLIYGPPVDKDHRIAWDQLRAFGKSIQGSWLCVGDFNDVLYHFEKEGGKPKATRKVLNFQSLLDDCGLFDLNYNGAAFTWFNKRAGEAFVKERLDRALGNIALLNSFPKAQVFVNDPVGSDHGALVTNLAYCDTKSPRTFKFELAWLSHPEYREVMRKGWFNSGALWEDFILELLRRLEDCKKGLIEWSKKAFPNNRKVLSDLSQQLRDCYEDTFTEEKKAAVEKILRDMEEVWDREELFWFQRSRVNWLHFGDSNSKFFHASVVQRRQRNKILRLKGDDGQWISSEEDIAFCFSEFYKGLFRQGGSRDFSKVLSYVNLVITAEDNDMLLRDLGFAWRWVNIIMGCISSVRFDLLLSGKSVAEVIPGRGVCQGDPLSPYLFIIVADVLSSMVSFHAGNGDLKGVKLARHGPTLTHCFFADDALFFMSADRHNCMFLKTLIEEYCLAFGQETNLDKSCLYFSANASDAVKVDVGNGGSIRFWQDRWIPGLVGSKLSSPPPADSVDLRVNEVITDGRWELSSVRSSISPLEEKAILSIPIDTAGPVDKLVWGGSKNGEYLVKSGYLFAREGCVRFSLEAPSCSYSPPPGLWKVIWSLKVVPKVKSFLWRACVRALPTREAIFKRRCSSSPYCEVCLDAPETIEHAILLCNWARGVWFACPLAIKISPEMITRFDVWCTSFLLNNPGLDGTGKALFACTCWEIWKARCNHCFQGPKVDPISCCNRICSAVLEFVGSFDQVGSVSLRSSPPLASEVLNWWSLPSPGNVKINVDGAFCKESLEAGIGIIARDSEGRLLKAFCQSINASSCFMCEAMALKEALSWIPLFPGSGVTFEMDCEDLFNMVSKANSLDSPWQCSSIVADVIKCASLANATSYSLVRRLGNQAADWLAKWAVKGLGPYGWVVDPPPPLASVLTSDREVALANLSRREGIG
ncbi:reverse transcriptase [Senna tora]|uniref:Reverse transcriptase n=1 Tax=Senna tora TaxID=362788 RepID=A0A834TIL6_9FABA|nr:reverse transcriptase [Senna tora]